MNKPLTEKERLLKDLTQIAADLDELESSLEVAFASQRSRLREMEQRKISDSAKNLSALENKLATLSQSENMFYPPSSNTAKSLKLEMGY